jgi:Tfp pilus assembly protein PilO
MSRLVNMGDVKIKAQSKPTINDTIQVSAVATTYVYQDTQPMAAAQKGKRPTPGAAR